MSSSKIGYQVAANMDKILNTKVLSKFAKKEEKVCDKCDCKKDCKCKDEKKVSKKADAVLYLIKSSETLDKLGLHKIASDLLMSAAGLLDDPEQDRMQKENEIISKMEAEKDPQLFRDLSEAEIRHKLLSKDDENFDEEDSFSLEPSVVEALEKTQMFSDEELAQLKKMQESSEEEMLEEDDSMAWDAEDGDLVENLGLDTSMAWDDESSEDTEEESTHKKLYSAIESDDEDKINYFLNFDNKFVNMAIAHKALLTDSQLDKLISTNDNDVIRLLLDNNKLTSEQKEIVQELSDMILKYDSSMAWDDESSEDDLEFEEGELEEEDDYLQDSLLDNKFLSDEDEEEDVDLDKQFHKKFDLSDEEDLEEDEELEDDSLDDELDDLYNQFSSTQRDYDGTVLGESDEEDADWDS